MTVAAPRAPGWGLSPDEVPNPPGGYPSAYPGTYGLDLLGWLRWSIAVMDADDPRIGFAAVCLAHVATHGGPLPDGPADAALRMFVELEEDWNDEALDCQLGGEDVDPDPGEAGAAGSA